jgi:UDP-glucuronate decarboxylase
MPRLFRKLLENTVDREERLAESLDGSSLFITGGSGFLAANLLIFLDTLRKKYNKCIELAASARRPFDAIPLFEFLGAKPFDSWQVAPVEETIIPEGRRWIVVHTASYGSPVDYMRETLATFSSNTSGICRLFQNADSTNRERIVYFSTAEVYGQPPNEKIPTSEDFLGGPDLLDKRSIYAESKRMAEVLGVNLSDAHGIPLTVLRPWNVYGPGQRLDDGRVPMEFLRQMKLQGEIKLLSDGSPTRSFCHVLEAIPQIAACLRPRQCSQSVFNIGRQGDEIKILQLAIKCALILGGSPGSVAYNPNIQAAGMKRCQPDTTRISDLLGSKCCPIELNEGLETCVEWIDFLTSRK